MDMTHHFFCCITTGESDWLKTTGKRGVITGSLEQSSQTMPDVSVFGISFEVNLHPVPVDFILV